MWPEHRGSVADSDGSAQAADAPRHTCTPYAASSGMANAITALCKSITTREDEMSSFL